MADLSLVYGIAVPVVLSVPAWLAVRSTLRKDRADKATAAQRARDRIEQERRQAVADAVAPLRDEIGELRSQLRERDRRINHLLDERMRGR